MRAARRLYRRRVQPAAVPGRAAADDHLFYVHAGPDPWGRRDRALPAAGLHHPPPAGEGEPAVEAAGAHGARGRRPGAGVSRRDHRDPRQ